MNGIDRSNLGMMQYTWLQERMHSMDKLQMSRMLIKIPASQKTGQKKKQKY
jgi:hypothetical protein